MFKLEDSTKSLLKEIISLLGYLSLGIAIWNATHDVLVICIYALLAFYLLLLLRYLAANRRIKEVESQLALANNSADDLQRVQGLFEGMLGLFLYITEPPQSDTNHHYSFAQEEYVIQGDDGVYNWILKGCSIQDEPSTGLTLKYSGDSPIDASSLALSVTDQLTGHRYTHDQFHLVKDFPYLKILNVTFAQPILKGQCFDLKLSCRWDNTFTRSRKYDYVFFAWGYYAAQGIDKLIGRLICDVPIGDIILERLEDGRLIKERRQPKLVDTATKHFVFEWEVDNPRQVYILRFTKEVDNASRNILGG